MFQKLKNRFKKDKVQDKYKDGDAPTNSDDDKKVSKKDVKPKMVPLIKLVIIFSS